MKEKYTAAYLGVLFPCSINFNDYKQIMYGYFDGISSNYVDEMLFSLVKEQVLIIEDGSVIINPDLINEICDEINNLSDFTKQHLISKLTSFILNLYNTSQYCNLMKIYTDIISFKYEPYFLESYSKSFEKELLIILCSENRNLSSFEKTMKVFTSPFINDELKIEFINILYKFNQNMLVTNIYKTISHKNKLSVSSLLKVSSAFFMTSEIQQSQIIIDKIKCDYANDNNVLMTIKAIELVNNYETSKNEKDFEKIKDDFLKLVYSAELSPNISNLLLKMSSRILSHEEAIQLMLKTKLSDHMLHVYNNLGALYLAEGYKKYLLNNKDKTYIIKAEKYLEFAKLFGNDQGEYSPYLELNLLSLKVCREYIKKSIIKKYNAVYKNFRKLINSADSLYFKSIVYCNCFILEKLTSNNEDLLDFYRKKLDKIRFATDDLKVKEKILDFLKFNPNKNESIPIWVITETHY